MLPTHTTGHVTSSSIICVVLCRACNCHASSCNKSFSSLPFCTKAQPSFLTRSTAVLHTVQVTWADSKTCAWLMSRRSQERDTSLGMLLIPKSRRNIVNHVNLVCVHVNRYQGFCWRDASGLFRMQRSTSVAMLSPQLPTLIYCSQSWGIFIKSKQA